MIRIGTSGYNYPEWRGTFYPEKFSPAKMLPYYAERFSTVEINYTFYRMPNAKTVAGWVAETPAGFSFTLKAPQRITHFARLREIGDPLRYFVDTAAGLGPKLGPVLFQLPPTSRKIWTAWAVFSSSFPRDSAVPSSSATTAGSPTMSTNACAPPTPRSASPTPRRRPRPSR